MFAVHTAQAPKHQYQAMCLVAKDSLALLQGSFGPSGPKLEKESENEFPGPLGQGAQKVVNGVEKESK